MVQVCSIHFANKELLRDRRVLILIFFFIPLLLSGQPDHSVLHFNSSNGLPQNQVQCMAFDKTGYLWLGTYGGLCRFDGQRFITFDNLSGTTLRSSRITNLFTDADGTLLFTDELNYVYRIKDNKISDVQPDRLKYRVSGTGAFFNYTSFAENKQLVSALTEPTNPFSLRSRVINENECYLAIAQNIYYLNNREGIIRLIYNKQSDTDFAAACVLVDGFFIINTRGHNIVYRQGIQQPDITINDSCALLFKKGLTRGKYIIEDNKSFFAIDNRLYQLIRQNDTIKAQLVVSNIIPPAAEIITIKKDDTTGILFMGTYTKGLYIFKPSQFRLVKNDKKDQGAVMYDVVKLANGSYASHAGLFDLEKGYTREFSLSIKTRSLYKSRDGTIFFSTEDNALFKTDNLFRRPRLIKNVIGNVCFVQDKRDTIWLSMENVLWQINKNGVLKKIADIPQVFLLFEYDDESLWLLTKDSLLTFSIIQKKITGYVTKNNLIRSVFRARDSSVWITTYGNGIYKYEREHCIPLPLDSKGALKYAHNFYEDDKGCFWIPTNNGLIQCLKADLDACIKGEEKDPYYYHYNNNDGLLSNEFNGGGLSPYTVDDKGRLLYPSIDGIVYFSPACIKQIPVNRTITIHSIAVDDKLIDNSKEIIIKPGFGRILIDIDIPYFGNPENLVLEYMVEGLSDKWYKAENTQIVLNRLPPATYKLVIRKRNGFGVNNYQYKTFNFTVLPYFYQTLWFIVALILSGILITALFFYLKSRSVIAVNKRLESEVERRTNNLYDSIKRLNITLEELHSSEQKLYNANLVKEKAIAIILHDIKTPINYLGRSAKMLHDNINEINMGEIAKMAGGFSETSNSVNTFLEELLQWLLMQKDDFSVMNSKFMIHDLFAEIIFLYKDIVILRGNQLLQKENSVDFVINTDRNILKLILRNLVDNAAKYTTNGKIELYAERCGDKVCLIVEDNGRGMSEAMIEQLMGQAQHNNGITHTDRLGYTLIFGFLNAINCSIEIKSKTGVGTQVILKLFK